jgi:hypothetical protein
MPAPLLAPRRYTRGLGRGDGQQGLGSERWQLRERKIYAWLPPREGVDLGWRSLAQPVWVAPAPETSLHCTY